MFYENGFFSRIFLLLTASFSFCLKPLVDHLTSNICNQKHKGSLLEGFTQTQISTLAVKDKLMVAGGFQGELVCKVCHYLAFAHLNNHLLYLSRCYLKLVLRKDYYFTSLFSDVLNGSRNNGVLT